MIHRCRAGLLWLALVLAGTSSLVVPAFASALVFPASDTVLRDGDLLLVYAPLPVSSFNRVFGRPRGPYGHALVFVDLPDQGPHFVDFSADGLRLHGPELLGHLYQAALVRLKHPPEPGRLAAALAGMRQRYQAGQLRFDFAMRRSDADDGVYYCTEFLSHLFRQAGLADPFPDTNGDEAPEFWHHWARTRLAMDYGGVISPNAPLYSPDFLVMAQYRRDDPGLARREVILDTLYARAGHYVADLGLEPGEPSWATRTVAAMAGQGLFDMRLIAGLPPVSRDKLLVTMEFVFDVQARVERSLYLDDAQDQAADKVAQLTIDFADAVRSRYFVPRGDGR